MTMYSKLIQHTTSKCPNTGCTIVVIGWKNPKGWTKEEGESVKSIINFRQVNLGWDWKGI